MRNTLKFIIALLISTNLIASQNGFGDISDKNEDQIIFKAPVLEYINVIVGGYSYSGKDGYHYVLNKYDYMRAKKESKNQEYPGFLPWLKEKMPQKYDIIKSELELRKCAQLSIKEYGNEYNLIDYKGSIIQDYRKGRYVMSKEGNLYISHQDVRSIIQYHTSFLLEEEIICAGEICIQGGKITYIDNESGHFLPLPYHLDQCINILSNKKVIDSKCEFSFIINNNQRKNFNSIQEYKVWGEYILNENQKKRLSEQLKNDKLLINGKLAPLFAEKISPLNYELFSTHKENFDNNLKDLDSNIRKLLWKGYLRKCNVIYYTDIHFGSNAFKKNSEKSNFEKFIKYSSEFNAICRYLEFDLDFKETLLTLEKPILFLKKNFTDPFHKHKIEDYEIFEKERENKTKEKFIQIVKMIASQETELVDVNFIAEHLYNHLDKNYLKQFSNSRYIGNAEIINSKEFSEWMKRDLKTVVRQNSFCKTQDILITKFILTDNEDSAFELFLKYKHSSKIENFYIILLFDAFKKNSENEELENYYFEKLLPVLKKRGLLEKLNIKMN